MPHSIVEVPGFPRPRGYSNGIVARGRVLSIAGQIGWNEQEKLVSSEFVPQFEQALRNVVAVVKAAGGETEHITQMTIFVTSIDAYREAGLALGKAWRAQMGKTYPAMALIGCAGLLEPGAQVEILATAVLPNEAP